MYRITQNLFEDIQKVTSGVSAQEQQTPVEESQVDKAHFCATHVEHALLGYGECISEDHAKPDEDGNIAWYNVKFPVGIHKVESNQLRVVEGKSHTHSKKMAEESEEIEEAKEKKPEYDKDKVVNAVQAAMLKSRGNVIAGRAERAAARMNAKIKHGMKEEIEEAKKPNDGNLANNYPPYDKVTRGDVIAGRLGKDEMGGKKKVKEDVEELDEKAGYSAKSARAGKDIGKKGKTFSKIAASASKRYGSKAAGERVAGAVLAKLRKEDVDQMDEAKDMSAFDWKSKVKAPQSNFASKKISTGTVYTKKYKAEPDDADDMKKNKKSKGMDEGVTQTIINHNDFVLEVTDNPTFKDYFNAIQAIVPSSNEEIQKELVTIATEAYNEGYDDIILESMIRVGFEDRINNYRKQGYSVIAENYVPDADEPYVEYTLEKDGDTIQYVHTGKVFLSNDE
jgi:hypothetical protein